MSMALTRQLAEDDKRRVLERHGRNCFVDGHAIPDDAPVAFDHIRAHSAGGPTEINNIAPTCVKHNQEKGALSLYDFRAQLRLKEFFAQGDRLTLGNLLAFLKEKKDIEDYASSVNVQTKEGEIRLESATFADTFQLYRCPITDWQYFYTTLPISILDSDDDDDQDIGLQPRYLILSKVFDLFIHFQTNPVLQPSLGRIVNNKIKLFDGQHKAAALLWNGRTDIECKIYLEPNMRRLNQTNISAHEKFAQTRFFTSIMVGKLGAQFGVDFEEYKNLEDGQPKSESGFLEYLQRMDNIPKREVTKRFRSFLYRSILEDEENRFARLVAVGNRTNSEQPISLDGLEKSLFTSLLYRESVSHNITTDDYMREHEVQNMVKIMNILDELALQHWNPKVRRNDDLQLKLVRFVRPRFMRAWSESLKGAICGVLNLFEDGERARPLYRQIDDDQMKAIRYCITRLVNWGKWDSPAHSDIDTLQQDSNRLVKEWVTRNGRLPATSWEPLNSPPISPVTCCIELACQLEPDTA